MSNGIFMLEWSVSYHELLAKELAEREIRVTYWSGVERRGLKFGTLKSLFPGIITHSTFDAVRGIPPVGVDHWNFPPPDPLLLAELLECESEILSMMNRMDYIGDFSVNERKRLYYRMVRYWSGILDQLKPEAVVFSISPHMIFDYVAYVLCKKKGIRTFMFDYTRVPGRILRAESIQEGPSDLRVGANIPHSKIDDLDPAIRAYYENQVDPNQDSTPFYMKRFQEKGTDESKSGELSIQETVGWPKHIARVIKQKMILWRNKIAVPPLTSLRPIGFRQYWCEKRKWEKKKRALQMDYQKRATSIDFSRNYIYVPLNYQPERTTSPLGGRFVSQELLIEIVAGCLPEGWEVVVKEHPRQTFPGGSHAHQGRDPDFYSAIAAIPKVRLATMETSTFELIENAKAIATATGTAGWEGLLRGKPALVFGYPWYLACKGVYPIRSLESCREVFRALQSGKAKFESADVIDFLAEVSRHSIHAYVDPIFEKHSGITQAESVRTIADSLASSLGKNFHQN